MEDAEKRVQEAGVQASWDEDTRQNYAQWDTDGGTYKIWLEDSQSLEEKLKLIKKNDLAGRCPNGALAGRIREYGI